MMDCISKEVVNLSDITLTDSQLKILARGLNVCPTPLTLNPGNLRTDFDNFHRRLRLLNHFKDVDNDISQPYTDTNLHCIDEFAHPKFKSPSTFNPTGSPILETFITLNEHDYNFREVRGKLPQCNLSPGEMQALYQLKQMEDIIIKQADKGKAVVVQNRTDYLKEGFRQLSDAKFYKKLDNNPTRQYMEEINGFINHMFETGELEDSTYEYLLNTECRTSIFYMLPKIHKGTKPFTKCRPIVSAVNILPPKKYHN